jgi:hypothetical protein
MRVAAFDVKTRAPNLNDNGDAMWDDIPLHVGRTHHATYRVETPLELERAAAVLAGEQSSGTFVDVPGETESSATDSARASSV